ncbi:MAG: hypothetical protein ACJASB_002674 [Shewanella psychromarinicola]|jgi:hypothetical protein
MLRGGWEFQEGTAVGFLLVWCGRSATTLVAAGHKNKNKNIAEIAAKIDHVITT